MNERDGQTSGQSANIRVADIEIAWDLTTGTCTFERLPVAMMWVDTTLAGLMAGVQAMVGTDRFAMALQSEGCKSVEADWQVISASPDFETGFATIARIAAVAGWGQWELVERDDASRTCLFRVRDPWEARYQRALGVCWGSGMLAGKLAGYCTRLYGTNCWADQTAFAARGADCDEFLVHPSPRTIDEEIGWLMQNDLATRGDLVAALERLQAEIEQRRMAEERARLLSVPVENLLDSAGVWLHVLDSEGRVVIWNKAAQEISGYPRERVLGRNRIWADLCPESRDPEDPNERLHGIRSGKSVENLETLIRTADGRARVLMWSVRQLLGHEGLVEGSLGMALDITERKAAQEALSRSEERLRLAFEGTTDGHWDWNLANDDAYYSPRCFTMLGYEPDSLRASIETWHMLMHPDDAGKARSVLNDYLEQRIPAYTQEFRLRCADGSWRWMLSRGKIVEWTADGKPTRMTGTLSDVTERRREEEKRIEFERYMLHAQKLESLGLMAGGIAHDFNNLLMAIQGNLDLALSRIPAHVHGVENIRQAMKAAERSAALTQQMLAYSGKGHFLVRPLVLGKIVHETAALLRASIPKSAKIEIATPPSLPCVLADESQMHQILMNLVTNAAEALGNQEGTIFIRTGVVEADTAMLRAGRVDPAPPPGRYVRLDVVDAGCGMDEPTSNRFLDPFFSTKAMGRGLGMSAVIGIVRGHKGTMLVDTLPGRGTTISVLLPAVAAAASPAMPPPLPVQARFTGRALVIDDEEQVRTTCANMLETMGMTCAAVEGGREAIRLLEQDPHAQFNCAILDLSMPGMDGFETARELKRVRPGLKIVLSSGYDEKEAIRRFGHDGPTAFIQKPYNTRRLGEVMQRVLG